MPTARSARGIDIIAYNREGSYFVGVQVKTLSKRNPVPLGTSLNKVMGDYWIIVNNMTKEPSVASRMNWWLAASLLLLVSACATTNPPGNQAITAVDESSGYRRLGETTADSMGNTLVFLAFSGGGTRAAALSYGVMQELRDTLVVSDGAATPLLGEVDAISSVSGGSFTAAYYGLHREGLFTDFEDDFLRKDVQGALINRMINPFLWFGRPCPVRTGRRSPSTTMTGRYSRALHSMISPPRAHLTSISMQPTSQPGCASLSARTCST